MRTIPRILANGALCLCLLLAACDDDGPGGLDGDVVVITNVTPSQVAPGQSVTITGRNFGSDASLVTVTFGGSVAPIVSVVPTTIVAIVPTSLAPGSTTLRVSVAGASTSATTTITIVAPPQPVINGFEPEPGVAGDTLVIFGEEFGSTLAAVTVTIGGTPAQIASVTDVAITVVIPGTVSGTVPVVVTVAGEASAPRNLTVIVSGPPAAGAIFGRVTSEATGQPIAGATVTTTPATAIVVTDADGNYRIEGVTPRSYRVTASSDGFDTGSVDVTVAAGQAVQANIILTPLGQSRVFGRVTNAATEDGLEGAQVVLSVIGDTVPVIGDTIPIASDVTDSLGNYTIENVGPGSYVLTARASGFSSLSVDIIVVPGQFVAVHFPLTPSSAMAVRSTDLAVVGSRSDRDSTAPWAAAPAARRSLVAGRRRTGRAPPRPTRARWSAA